MNPLSHIHILVAPSILSSLIWGVCGFFGNDFNLFNWPLSSKILFLILSWIIFRAAYKVKKLQSEKD